jgi:tetratricopeptide (TPR) repeat protein
VAQPEVRRLSRRIGEIGQDDAWSLGVVGTSMAWICREYAAAQSFAERGTVLNPNLANGWVQRGAVSMLSSVHAAAIEHLSHARSIDNSSLIAGASFGYVSLSYLLTGKYDEAVSCAIQSVSHNPAWLFPHLASAAAHAFLGEFGEAHKSLASLRSLNPTLRLSNFGKTFDFPSAQDIDHLGEGLRLAGLPE